MIVNLNDTTLIHSKRDYLKFPPDVLSMSGILLVGMIFSVGVSGALVRADSIVNNMLRDTLLMRR